MHLFRRKQVRHVPQPGDLLIVYPGLDVQPGDEVEAAPGWTLLCNEDGKRFAYRMVE